MEALWADVRGLRRQIDEVRNVSSDSVGEATLQALAMLDELPQRIARAATEALRQQHELNLRDLKQQWSHWAAQTERLAAQPQTFAAHAERLPFDRERRPEAYRQGGNVEVVGRAPSGGRGDGPLNLEDFWKEWRLFAADLERSLHLQMKQVAARVRAAEVEVVAQAMKEMATAATADRAKIISEFDARFEWLVNQLSDRFVALGNELVRIEKRLADQGCAAPATNGRVESAAPATNGRVES
ncbi:MAG: hypothetical protein ACRDZ8_08295, partial [Acidimicrobiales bacterium]